MKAYTQVVLDFDHLQTHTALVDKSYGYGETLHFLNTTKAGGAEEIMLSQSEFLALDTDDSALSTLQGVESSLDRVLAKTDRKYI